MCTTWCVRIATWSAVRGLRSRRVLLRSRAWLSWRWRLRLRLVLRRSRRSMRGTTGEATLRTARLRGERIRVVATTLDRALRCVGIAMSRARFRLRSSSDWLGGLIGVVLGSLSGRWRVSRLRFRRRRLVDRAGTLWGRLWHSSCRSAWFVGSSR